MSENAAPAERNDVVNLQTVRLEGADQSQGKVLVQQDLHDA